MEKFKGSEHDYTAWTMKDWEAEEKRKDEVFNKYHTAETKCVFVGGEFDGLVMTIAEVLEKCKIRGKVKDHIKERGMGWICPYAVFDNAPLVDGYLSPMAGTSGCPLRYETMEVYEQLSE